MISGIDHECDIDVYLEAEEVERLPNEVLEGVLIKVRKPKRQGKTYISVNDSRSNENGFGIGVYDEEYWGKKQGFKVELFMADIWYKELRERGIVGLRHRMRDGSKVHIYDRSKLSKIDESWPEHLEFYRDNKDRLHEDLG